MSSMSGILTRKIVFLMILKTEKIVEWKKFAFKSNPNYRMVRSGQYIPWNMCMVYCALSCIGCINSLRRVVHICTAKLTISGSDNGLSPERHQAIIWTNAAIIMLIESLRTKFSEILIKIQTFPLRKITFQNVVCEMLSISSQPQCVNQVSASHLCKDVSLTLGQSYVPMRKLMGWVLGHLRCWSSSTMWMGCLMFSSTTTEDIWMNQIFMCCMLSMFDVSSQIVVNMSESSLLLSQ